MPTLPPRNREFRVGALGTLIVLLTLGTLPLAAAHSEDPEPWPPTQHSPHVVSFSWEPREPGRGQAVAVHATVHSEGVREVVLEVCRVQAYSCKQPVAMKPGELQEGAQPFSAENPWDGRFLRDTTDVGLALLLRFENGTQERSPIDHWPQRPADLPAEAAPYYYYRLPPPAQNAPVPAAAALAGLLIAAAAVGGRRP